MLSSEAPTGDRWFHTFLLAAGVTLLFAAAGLPWWRTIDAPEPPSALLGRGVALLLGGSVAYSILRRNPRTRLSYAAAWLAILLPVLQQVYLVTTDAPAISAAIEQTAQARRLIESLEATDVNPQVAWTEQREIRVLPGFSNDYTLVDALESASYFLLPGWWLCMVAGILLVVTFHAIDASACRQDLRAFLPAGAVLLAVFALRCFLPLTVSGIFLRAARLAAAEGDPDRALSAYREAARWDRRLEYRASFSIEQGRILARAGRATPEAWAVIGDALIAQGDKDRGFDVYRLLAVPGQTAPVLPSLSLRWSYVLQHRGATEYNEGRFRSAIDHWERAVALDPRNVELQYALGLGYARVRDYETAARWWKRLATLNEKVGMFRSDFVAAVIYRKMITARAHAGLAWCYFNLGQTDLALKYDAASKQQVRLRTEETR
ncbi:MAG: tetratricopeptide repeat protein [Capsulimonadales bacterium]|nr:tetratricopeptide repeat protein [Capsulimonadales bacterium]